MGLLSDATNYSAPNAPSKTINKRPKAVNVGPKKRRLILMVTNEELIALQQAAEKDRRPVNMWALSVLFAEGSSPASAPAAQKHSADLPQASNNPPASESPRAKAPAAPVAPPAQASEAPAMMVQPSTKAPPPPAVSQETLDAIALWRTGANLTYEQGKLVSNAPYALTHGKGT